MLRLLFITQKIDQNDDILGVYHKWAARLAGKISRLNIICLFLGAFSLPANVSVFSLGKEKGGSDWSYFLNFYRYIWRLRNQYDVVFVHMNPGYILMGWPLWKILGKKIVYWNANYKVNIKMKLALLLADKGVTSIREAFVPDSAKITAVGQGIDVDFFKKDQTSSVNPDSLLFLGRISPVKNLDVLVESAKILKERGIRFSLDIVGAPLEKDEGYYQKIKDKAKTLEREGLINFLGSVPNLQTPRVYNSHQFFVNLTESRSFDKSILEAMACQTLVLVSNEVYKNIFPSDLAGKLMFKEKNPNDLAEKIEQLLKLSAEEKKSVGEKLREIVVKNHNLDNLVAQLVNIFQNI